jgi:hypothetical protein
VSHISSDSATSKGSNRPEKDALRQVSRIPKQDLSDSAALGRSISESGHQVSSISSRQEVAGPAPSRRRVSDSATGKSSAISDSVARASRISSRQKVVDSVPSKHLISDSVIPKGYASLKKESPDPAAQVNRISAASKRRISDSTTSTGSKSSTDQRESELHTPVASVPSQHSAPIGRTESSADLGDGRPASQKSSSPQVADDDISPGLPLAASSAQKSNGTGGTPIKEEEEAQTVQASMTDNQLASGQRMNEEEEQTHITAPEPAEVTLMDEDDEEPLGEEELAEFLKKYGDGPIGSDDNLDLNEAIE